MTCKVARYKTSLVLGLIVLSLIIFVIGIIFMVRDRQKYNSYKRAFLYISFGLFLLLFSTVGNSLNSGRWDKDYIIAFFC